MNTLVIIDGMLHEKAEVKYTKSGKALATFSVAVAAGAGKPANIFKVTAWESVAEQVAGLSPETKFTVYGRLTSRTYEWQGQTKTATDIVADYLNIRFLDTKRQGQTHSARPQEVDDSDIPF